MKKGLLGITLIAFAAIVWWMFLGGDNIDLADYDPHLEKGEKSSSSNSQTDQLLKNIKNARS